MNLTLLIVSVISLVVAAGMAIVAWRVVRDERLRSEARVERLAADIHGESADIHGEPVDAALEDGRPLEPTVDFKVADRSPVSAGDLFARPQQRSRLPLVARAAALAVGAIVAGSILFGRSATTVESKPAAPRAAAAGQATPAPLQLVALGHERDADGLTVRGVLRNPTTGAEVSHLTAVVLVFDHDGGFVGSGRAEVQSATLGPGSETTFVVTVSGAPDVEKYRVSFRTEQDIVPHVDLRS